MGIWESALILLGIGIVSERFGAGVGLGELGTGIRTLAAAPLGGIGTGLGEFSGGLRSFAEALGDIGRGFGELFKNIPGYGGGEGFGGGGGGVNGNGAVLPNGNGNGLTQVGGGDDTSDMTGGGGNVPNGRIFTLGTHLGQITGTYADIWGFWAGQGLAPPQIQQLLNPIWDFDPSVSMPPGTPGGYNV